MNISAFQLPVHPVTGLRALGYTSRGPIWPQLGGSPENDPEPGGGDPNKDPDSAPPGDPESKEVDPDPGKETEPTETSNGKPWAVNKNTGEKLGFPADTPSADMSLDEQVAYWKHNSRKWEARAGKPANGEESEEVQTLRARVGELEGKLRTTDEQAQHEAIESARTEGYATARAELLPQLRDSQLQTYATPYFHGEKATERLTTFLQGINTEHFLAEGEDHLIDGAKVIKHLEGLGLTRGDSIDGTPGLYPNVGQGQQRRTKKTNWGEVGRAEAKRRQEASAPTGYQFS
ncbi:head scaffolding protein [Gordonia phage Yvonnetastic]|uniref:Scaffolding protein n=1 Tax=Gordonia phage Yvonnetastic TaxID=1821566 RepID=A0A142K8Z2_9CAUD|nr:head scaffolding protein [Gordonia phage Yvonnetastic]AMS02575.1 hypothetical protein SEA_YVONNETASTIC_31 [Gordonia phage Yvonnetastic]